MLHKYSQHLIKLSSATLLSTPAELEEYSKTGMSAVGHAVAASDNLNIQKLIKLNPDFNYVRFRAIGALETDGPNSNHDAFPYSEFEEDTRPNYGYASFINKRAFVEHNSSDIENSIGNLVASYLNRFNVSQYGAKYWRDLAKQDSARVSVLATRKPHEDGSIEVLMAIDKVLAPKIARMVETDSPVGCSMGTNIDYSECSVCGNRAQSEAQYCSHIKFSKGGQVFVSASQIRDLLNAGILRVEWLPWVMASESDRKEVLASGRRLVRAKVFEINYGLSFFELSVVANPAFNRGYKLQRVASSSLIKNGFRQLIPMISMGNREIEVRFNVSESFFDNAALNKAATVGKNFSDWSNQEKVDFLRDSKVAKNALEQGAVENVLVSQTDAPHVKASGFSVEPSSEPGFYAVTNPDSLISAKFAVLVVPRGVYGSLDSYVCSWCKQAYSASTGKVLSGKYNAVTYNGLLGTCPDCAKGIVDKELGNYCVYASATDSAHLMYKDTDKDLFNFADFGSLVGDGAHPQELVDYLYQNANADNNANQRVDSYVDALRSHFGNLVKRDYKGMEGAATLENKDKATTKQGVYNSLPSTVEDIKDKGINIEKTELNSWREGADIGSNMIDGEKPTRENGTVFLDAISAKAAVTKNIPRIKSTYARVSYLLKISESLADGKLPKDIPPMLGEVKKDSVEPIDNKVDEGFSESKDHEKTEEDVIYDAVETLDKILVDLPLDADFTEGAVMDTPAVETVKNIVSDLIGVRDSLRELEKEEVEMDTDIDAVLANTKRFSNSLKEKLSSKLNKFNRVIADSESAVKFSETALVSTIKILKNSNNKRSATVKPESNDPKVVITPESIELLGRLASVLRGGDSANLSRVAEDSSEKKDEKIEEKKEEKVEEKKEEEKKDDKAGVKEAAIDDYPKEVSSEQKEGDYERFNRPSDKQKQGSTDVDNKATKEAAAMPPTGARDPGDYAEVGGIENIELSTWWGKMYPEYQKIKAIEEKTDFTTPEGKVDILTGVIAGRMIDPLTASKSKYAVVKLDKNDKPVEGLLISFADAAKNNQTEQAYARFKSDDYLNGLAAKVGKHGAEATIKVSLNGKGRLLTKAELEGMIPDRDDRSNVLYDTHEEKKDSNTARSGERLDGKVSEADAKGYYSKAFNDPGYAAALVKKYKEAAEVYKLRADSAEKKLAAMEAEQLSRVIAKRAHSLARLAAATGVIEFTKDAVYKQAAEYASLTDQAYEQVKKHLGRLPIVDQRAVLSYQIPEAENMKSGIANQRLDAVYNARIDDKPAEGLNVDGLQNAVKDNAKTASAKVSDSTADRVRRQVHAAAVDSETVPQLTVNNSEVGGVDLSRRFMTQEQKWQSMGIGDTMSRHIRSNRRQQ